MKKSKCYILMIHISNYYYFRQKYDRVFSEEISRVFYQTCESICAIRKLIHIQTCFKNFKCAPTEEFLICGIFDHTKYNTIININLYNVLFFHVCSRLAREIYLSSKKLEPN